jgi:small subunit ribosomal protein S30e
MLTRPVFQVEPQEKKKTPKGRAKKRITYTRRFVNVTLTGGKRKVSRLFYEIQKQSTADVAIDEPQPNLISIHRSSG